MSGGDDFLARWSRRKAEARAEPAPEKRAEPAPALANAQPPTETKASEPLPPVESLTPESDFQPFMRADVDPKVRGQALRTLFSDPQFNVMDGLDIYTGDYSQPDPLPEGWLEKLQQVSRLGDFNKIPEKPADPALENDSQVPEKIESKQDLPEPPSSDPSNTPDAVVPPTEVPE